MGACCSCLRPRKKEARRPPVACRPSSGFKGQLPTTDTHETLPTRRSSAAPRHIRGNVSASSLTASLCSSESYQSCQDAFSQPGSSPRSTCLRMSLDNTATSPPQDPTLPSLRLSLDSRVARLPPPKLPPPPPSPPTPAEPSTAEDRSSVGAEPSCLPQLLGRTLGALGQARQPAPAPGAAGDVAAPGKRGEQAPAGKAPEANGEEQRKCKAGASLTLLDDSMDKGVASMCCEDGHGPHYHVRSTDYMDTKIKIPSAPALYELVTADTFSFPRKQHHIAQLLDLPPCGPAVTLASGTPLPQLLIINIQIPSYAPSIFGRSDGPGCSIVFYFRLRPSFNAEDFPNQAALRLLERFLLDGREADGACTRDRFKLIGQVVNVEEWSRLGPLSSGEHKLLSAYNEKPLLTRPQHSFIRGENYLEIDIDIHAYSYIARAGLQAYIPRLGPVVFENAFVIQGNSCDDLPEQVLAAGRIYRADLSKLPPFSSYLT